MEQEEVIREYGYRSTSITNDHLTKTFTRMGAGLFVTAVISYFTFVSGVYLTLPYILLLIVELGIVLGFSAALRKASAATCTIMFYVYAIVNGLTFSTIFAAYEIGSIATSFVSAGALFIGLAIVGKTTKVDLSKFGTILTVGLIVGIVVSIINIFIGSTVVDLVINIAMLLIFCGLTAYDMQKFSEIASAPEVDHEKIYSYFALALYLDFINIFLKLLRLFGNRRR